MLRSIHINNLFMLSGHFNWAVFTRPAADRNLPPSDSWEPLLKTLPAAQRRTREVWGGFLRVHVEVFRAVSCTNRGLRLQSLVVWCSWLQSQHLNSQLLSARENTDSIIDTIRWGFSGLFKSIPDFRTSLSAGFLFAPSALSPPAAWRPAGARRCPATPFPFLLLRSALSRHRLQAAAEDWPEGKVRDSSAVAPGLFPEEQTDIKGYLQTRVDHLWVELFLSHHCVSLLISV